MGRLFKVFVRAHPGSEPSSFHSARYRRVVDGSVVRVSSRERSPPGEPSQVRGVTRWDNS
jgi:hypothetical protein